MTVLYAVVIGAAIGVIANIVGWLSDRGRSRAAAPAMSAPEVFAQLWLDQTESVLNQASPAGFETTQNAASTCIAMVRGLEDGGWWYAGYDSLDSFYAVHEARHPDIRLYASVSREIPIEDPNDPPNGTGEMIARRIAAHRHPSTAGI